MACRPIDKDGCCARTTEASAPLTHAYRQAAESCCSASPVDRGPRVTGHPPMREPSGGALRQLDLLGRHTPHVLHPWRNRVRHGGSPLVRIRPSRPRVLETRVPDAVVVEHLHRTGWVEPTVVLHPGRMTYPERLFEW